MLSVKLSLRQISHLRCGVGTQKAAAKRGCVLTRRNRVEVWAKEGIRALHMYLHYIPTVLAWCCCRTPAVLHVPKLRGACITERFDVEDKNLNRQVNNLTWQTESHAVTHEPHGVHPLPTHSHLETGQKCIAVYRTYARLISIDRYLHILPLRMG